MYTRASRGAFGEPFSSHGAARIAARRPRGPLRLRAVYFVIDLAFLSFIRPLRRAGLSLVLVPLAILEPVKPVAFYLTAKGHVLSGGAVLIFGEIIKVTLVEQVIEITKPKLMSFRWFAWACGQWEAVIRRQRFR